MLQPFWSSFWMALRGNKGGDRRSVPRPLCNTHSDTHVHTHHIQPMTEREELELERNETRD